MASIALDPRLLAPPDASANAATFRAYVTCLLGWSSFAKEKGSTVTISRDAQQQLMADGAFPIAASLRDDLRSKGIIEYDFQTLKVFCEGFFRMQPSFQDHIGVNEILHERAEFSPSLPGSQQLPNTTSEAEKNLVTLALLNHCQCRSPRVGFAMQIPVASNQMSVSACLHAIETSRNDLIENDNLPSDIGGTVTVCSNLNDFANSCDVGALFQNALNDDQLRLCIKLAVYRSRQQRHIDTDWDELPVFRIGTGFRERALGVAGADAGLCINIVRSIVDAIENLNLPQTHVLRAGEGANEPQRTSGVFGAWRRDVSGEVHLHYWKGPKNLIEIGWVSHPHDDMHLPNLSGN